MATGDRGGPNLLNRGFGSNKRWVMMNYNFERSFDHSAPTCMGSLLLLVWYVKGK